MLYDLMIVGGGIVGLACAREALLRDPDLRLVVLEKESRVACHQTGHNSGVIHSGAYYRPGSQKARMCVQGAAELIAFCQHYGIAHNICGKVVVATEPCEVRGLEELRRRASANGVPGVRVITSEELKEVEPYSHGICALLIPGAGITDYAQVSLAYAELVAASGGAIRTSVLVTGIQKRADSVIAQTSAGDFAARYVINCGGLQSDRIARLSDGKLSLRIVPFRGDYYEFVSEREHLVRGLIYPVPDPALPFLGVHLTRGIHGGVEAGPNAVLAFKREGYGKAAFDLIDVASMVGYPGFWKMARKHWRTAMGELHRSTSSRAFLRAVQRLIPCVHGSDIRPGRSGVRAQALSCDGTLLDDFEIVQSDRMMHVLNVPSPAATASMPIARAIITMLTKATVASKLRPRTVLQS